MAHWWTEKYNRPTTDPMFLDSTYPELHYEMFLDLYYERERLNAQLEQGVPNDTANTLLAKLNELNKVLEIDEPGYGSDPLIDKWERELAEGRMPDLDEEL